MRRLTAAACCVVLLAGSSASLPARESKFDEFEFRGCQRMISRLDNFAAALTDPISPQLHGLIRVYGGRKVERGEVQLYIQRIREYLIARRPVDPRRFDVTFGGYREKAGADLFVFVQGVTPREATPTVSEKEVVFRKGAFKASRLDCARTPSAK
ncbi:MAG TPA: hypothetical protein VK421_11860 [Pyrinomonadaceae bacterium]|nr:hypothetical protein [Pyrinomonadaceae bacterium]